MITCSWVVVCSQTIKNQDTGRISLIEILDSLTIPHSLISEEKPIFLPFEYDLAIYWKITDNDGKDASKKFRLKILDPVGEILLEGEQGLEVTESGTHITVLHFNGLPITGPGYYKFKVELPSNADGSEWEDVKVVSLLITYENSPEIE